MMEDQTKMVLKKRFISHNCQMILPGSASEHLSQQKDAKWDGQSSGIFERIVAKKTYCCGVATRRDPIPFDTGTKERSQRDIPWAKEWELKDINSEGKDVTAAVALRSYKKVGEYPNPTLLPTGPSSNPVFVILCYHDFPACTKKSHQGWR